MMAETQITPIREPYVFYKPIKEVSFHNEGFVARADEAVRQLLVLYRSDLDRQPSLKPLIEDAARAYIHAFAQGDLAPAYVRDGSNIGEDNAKRNALVTYQFESRLLDYMAAVKDSIGKKGFALAATLPPTAMLGHVIKTCIRCYDPHALRRFVETDYRYLAELTLQEMGVSIPGRRPSRSEEGQLEQWWKKCQQGASL